MYCINLRLILRGGEEIETLKVLAVVGRFPGTVSFYKLPILLLTFGAGVAEHLQRRIKCNLNGTDAQQGVRRGAHSLSPPTNTRRSAPRRRISVFIRFNVNILHPMQSQHMLGSEMEFIHTHAVSGLLCAPTARTAMHCDARCCFAVRIVSTFRLAVRLPPDTHAVFHRRSALPAPATRTHSHTRLRRHNAPKQFIYLLTCRPICPMITAATCCRVCSGAQTHRISSSADYFCGRKRINWN